jgi:uncharacterized membrane protein
MPKGRLEAFSGCIMAFAVTLLIYDFHLQDLDADTDNAGMIHALLALAPHYFIYVISFLICTVWWMGHHVFIHDLDRVDSRSFGLTRSIGASGARWDSAWPS